MTALLAAAFVACDSESPVADDDSLPPGPVTAEEVWFGGDREPEPEIRAGGVLPIWFKVIGPALDPELTVTVVVSSGDESARVTLEPVRLLEDSELCEVLVSAPGAIVVFQESDGSNPSTETSAAVRDELLSLGLVLREDFGDGISAVVPPSREIVSTMRSHPNVRALRPLPFPSWPAVLIEPSLAAAPANWYQYERWGIVGSADGDAASGCGETSMPTLPLDPGADLTVRYRQPDNGVLSSTATVVESLAEPDVEACLADVATLEIRDFAAREIEIREPGDEPPWQGHAALAAWFAEGNGRGAIGFKEAESSPTGETGTREAVSSETIREGLEKVCQAGAQEIRLRDITPSASVKIPPEAAPRLRTESIVDYVEPSFRVGPGPGDVRLESHGPKATDRGLGRSPD